MSAEPASTQPLIALWLDPAALQPLRVWSLIVTFFGDAVAPRGGEIGLGALTEVMGAFGLEPGAVRTALSRLARDGWVESRRHGRNAVYRLTPRAAAEAEAASARIYGQTPEQATHWTLLLLKRGADAERDRLIHDGAGVLGPELLIWPGAAPQVEGVALLRAELPDEAVASALAARAWDLDAFAGRYRGFVLAMQPVVARIAAEPPAGIAAVGLRTAVVHLWRRLALRNPGLPRKALPADWPGDEALRLTAACWRALAPASETWLGQSRLEAEGAYRSSRAALRFTGE